MQLKTADAAKPQEEGTTEPMQLKTAAAAKPREADKAT